MIDTKQLLDKFMGSGMAGGLAGGLAGGALTGLLANKKGREIAGSALKVGGVALAGGLAYKAYQSYRNKQSGMQQPAGAHMQPGAIAVDPSAFIPAKQDVVAQQSLSLLLLKAMISAAKADGSIDHGESSRIMAEINRLGLEPQEKALLFDEYSRPVDVQALAAEVQTQEQAVEVYAASLLVIGEQDAREAQYLHNLAAALGLAPALADEIQQTVLASLSGSDQQEQVA